MRKDKEQMTATKASDTGVIVVAPDDVAQMAVERNLRSALPRCEQAAGLLTDFGIKPTTAILHECVTMSEHWEQADDLTPTFQGLDEKAKWTHTMTTKAVFKDCKALDEALGQMLQSRTGTMTPKETREYSTKFYQETTALKEALLNCFKSNTNEEGIKDVVLKYVETDSEGKIKFIDNANERIKYDTAIKVDTPESIASYKAHEAAAEALNKFVDTLINANKLSVVSDIQQLFKVDPDTLKVSPSVIDYKLFSEK